jgi:Fe-S cluster biogenesis protein NfuA
MSDEKSDPLDRSAPALLEAVELELDRLRPALVADGGNIELLGVDADGTARVTFQGQCATCPAQQATLRIGLEQPLLEAVPGLTGLVAL